MAWGLRAHGHSAFRGGGCCAARGRVAQHPARVMALWLASELYPNRLAPISNLGCQLI